MTNKVLCHCADCRKIGGSTYSTNGLYDADKFKVTKGTPKQYKKVADGGNDIISNFWYVHLRQLRWTHADIRSGDCGSTMWREGESFPGKRVVKMGTLDDTSILDNIKVNAELYADNRPSWVAPQEGADQKKAMA